ncbi:outer membrane protein assembly factor BamA, partial [Klebsiella pneumoniae]
VLHLQVNAGRRHSVRHIRFSGNDTSRDAVLRREMRQLDATWLNHETVDQGTVRLAITGFFEHVAQPLASVNRTEERGKGVCWVKERNTGDIQVGLGVGTD